MDEFLQRFLPVIIPIIFAVIFIISILSIFSPKFRGKMISQQVKSLKYMMEESKDDIAKMAGTTVGIKKEVLDDNEDALTDIANKEAKLNAVRIKSAARAIKEGLTENNSIYCKHCGASIDSDSKFCKSCGKEQ